MEKRKMASILFFLFFCLLAQPCLAETPSSINDEGIIRQKEVKGAKEKREKSSDEELGKEIRAKDASHDDTEGGKGKDLMDDIHGIGGFDEGGHGGGVLKK